MIKKINSDVIIEEICVGALKKIVIYGAGGYGKTTYYYLKERYNVEIDSFVVSSKENIECDQIEGKEIIPISKMKDNDQCILIIAVSEQKQEELLNLALKHGFKKIYVVLNEFMRYMQSELNIRRLSPLEMLHFEVHITDHCNLNCKGCYHFSPLSERYFLSIDEFKKDFQQMARLCGDKVSHITLLGGEPLLHPHITKFFYIARQNFTKCKIEVLTNGILLKKMDEIFWEACVKNNILLSCTKYPVKVDYEWIEKKAASYGISITYHNDIGAGDKMLIKYPFDLSGTQPIKWNYEHCTRSNKCITLKHGKLYTCPMAAHAHLAKDFFDLDMELSNEDYINIYEAHNLKEITDFLIKPIPFCRYCNLKEKPEQQEWSVSKKNIDEWF